MRTVEVISFALRAQMFRSAVLYDYFFSILSRKILSIFAVPYLLGPYRLLEFLFIFPFTNFFFQLFKCPYYKYLECNGLEYFHYRDLVLQMK
jgi:hypothetical protein